MDGLVAWEMAQRLRAAGQDVFSPYAARPYSEMASP